MKFLKPKVIFIGIILTSITIGLLIYCNLSSETIIKITKYDNLFDNLLNLIGILFGFFGTVLAIMLSQESILVKRLRTKPNVRLEFYILTTFIIISAIGSICLIIAVQILKAIGIVYVINFILIISLISILFMSLVVFMYVFVIVINNKERKKPRQRTMGK